MGRDIMRQYFSVLNLSHIISDGECALCRLEVPWHVLAKKSGAPNDFSEPAKIYLEMKTTSIDTIFD